MFSSSRSVLPLCTNAVYLRRLCTDQRCPYYSYPRACRFVGCFLRLPHPHQSLAANLARFAMCKNDATMAKAVAALAAMAEKRAGAK